MVREMNENTQSEQEAEQLRMRPGLTGQSRTSLVDTVDQLETTEDGVRETEAVALRELRGSRTSKWRGTP